MKVLLVSSKFQPEYSGSGFRAHNLYQRLSNKFKINYDVVCNSLVNRKNEIYVYDSIEVNKISYPVEIAKLRGLKKNFTHFYQCYMNFIILINLLKKRILKIIT